MGNNPPEKSKINQSDEIVLSFMGEPHLTLKRMIYNPVNLTYNLQKLLDFKDWCKLFWIFGVGEKNKEIFTKLCNYNKRVSFDLGKDEDGYSILNRRINNTIISNMVSTLTLLHKLHILIFLVVKK